jgi:hypothetical protein
LVVGQTADVDVDVVVGGGARGARGAGRPGRAVVGGASGHLTGFVGVAGLGGVQGVVERLGSRVRVGPGCDAGVGRERGGLGRPRAAHQPRDREERGGTEQAGQPAGHEA